LLGSIVGFTLNASADDGISFNLTGSVNVAYGTSALKYGTESKHALYLNFGGPTLKLDVSDFSVGASLFPTLKMIMGAPTGMNAFSTALGFGPWVGYKKFVISVPFYFAGTAATDAAIGIGYRF
jgi:hypothetical protein